MSTREERQAARLAREEIKARLAACMPDFEGSEKQIAWAVDIYNRAVDMVAEEMSTLNTAKKECIQEELDKMPCSLEEAIAAHTSAKWWIERRELERNIFSFIARISGAWDRA